LDERRLHAVVTETLRITDEKYRPDLRLGDIDEWDSVAHLDLLSSIEQAFGVRFRSEEIVELTSLDEIRTRITATQEP
jgi:acyl carrier protein